MSDNSLTLSRGGFLAVREFEMDSTLNSVISGSTACLPMANGKRNAMLSCGSVDPVQIVKC